MQEFMLKKWINILLSVWLINSVTFPQIINVNDSVHSSSGTVLSGLNSWTDFLLFSLADDDSGSSDKKHHIHFHRKFVHTKSNYQTAFASVVFFFKTFGAASKTVKKCISTYVIGVAILPSYYSFLFRLSPF
ncbi:MAG: hypothetical protein EOP41_02250 [Sphingobacteriaceae bacterium]|nr:MAG: hypothetical protein EOP41_02250 [Sphingobacteriaceae bacterium]